MSRGCGVRRHGDTGSAAPLAAAPVPSGGPVRDERPHETDLDEAGAVPAPRGHHDRPDPEVPPVDFGEDGLDRNLRDAPPRDHRWAVRAGLLLVDACALVLPPLLLGRATPGTTGFVVVALSVLALSGAYRPRFTLSALEEAPFLVSLLGLALLLVAPFTLPGGADTALFAAALYSVLSLVVGRSISYAVLRSLRRRRVVEEPTLLLGGGELGMDLLTILLEHPEYGLRAVGFLDSGLQLDHRKPLGAPTDFERTFRDYGIRKVIVAYGTTREAELVGLLRSAAEQDLEIYIVPRFFDIGMAPGGYEVDDLWGVPLYRVRRAALRSSALRIKRLADVSLAGAGLLVLSPLLLALAIAVRLSSPGPALFPQPRAGQGGREITVLKFRTLRLPAPQQEGHPGSASGEAQGTGAQDSGTQESEAIMRARQGDVDRRQTAVGSLLRRTSLDELPQLWNILRGDMAFVGPRPEESGYAAHFGDTVYGYRDRHRLVVGLTGWAQVHGLRGETSIEERARFDNHYIEHWSLWKDLVIILRTLSAVVRQAVNGTPRAPSR